MRSNSLFTPSAFLRRNSGYIFFFCVVFIFTQVGFNGGRRYHAQLEEILSDKTSKDKWSPSNLLALVTNDKNVIREHPIPELMQKAEEKYKKKLGSQSKTLKAAVMEYERRYRRPPPKGFDAWWDFVQEHDVKMTDEYDGMIDDLKPFWSLPGEEIRRRSEQVGHLSSINLVRIRNGSATVHNVNPMFHDTEVSARARGFRSMLGKFVQSVCYIPLLFLLLSHQFRLAPRYGFSNQH